MSKPLPDITLIVAFIAEGMRRLSQADGREFTAENLEVAAREFKQASEECARVAKKHRKAVKEK